MKKGFNVHIVKPGMEAQYRTFMSGQTVDADGRLLTSALVMNTDVIEASSKPAAEKEMRSKYREVA